MIIGCGGVATYFLPLFMRTWTSRAMIMDGDKVEKRNLNRQVFSKKDIGLFKVEAMHKKFGDRVIPIPQFFTGHLGFIDPEQLDNWVPNCILVMADNHLARKLALDAADIKNLPVFISANEYFDSEAYVYFPQWKGDSQLDPRSKYPEIQNATAQGSPLDCNQEQISEPQLALANFAAAAKLGCMLWRWLGSGTTGKNLITMVHENKYEVISS